MKKDFLKELSNSTFIDNNSGDIQPVAHRHFNDEMIAALVAVDELNNGVVLDIAALTGGDDGKAKAEVWKYVAAAIIDPAIPLTLISNTSAFIPNNYGLNSHEYFITLASWAMLRDRGGENPTATASMIGIFGEYNETGITTYNVATDMATIPNVMDATGDSPTDAMSQKAVTAELALKASKDLATILRDGLMSKKNVGELASVVLRSYTSHAGRVGIDYDAAESMVVTKIKGAFTVEQLDPSAYVPGYSYKITHNCKGTYLPHVNLEYSGFIGQLLGVSVFNIQPDYFEVAFIGYSSATSLDTNAFPAAFNFTIEQF